MTPPKNPARLESLRKLHAADPSDADVCYMIAQEYGKGDEHAQAIEWYDRCMGADETYSYAYFFKAIALGELGRMPEAIEAIKSGLVQAQASGHAKAIAELTTLLEQMSG